MPLVAASLLIFAAGCGSKPPAAAEDADKGPAGPVAVEVVKAETRTMHKLLDLSGSFVPAQGASAKLTAATAGRVGKVWVVEGEHVHQGQLLATIDQRVQIAQKDSAAAALMAAQAQAAQSQISYQASASDQDTAVRSAEIGLEQAKLERDGETTQASLNLEGARADLQRLKAGARPQEIAQAHETTVQATVARDRAASELHRDQSLSADGYVSRRQLEDAKTALDTAQSSVASAQANESLVRAGARPEEIRSAEAKTSAAEQALISARSIGERKVRLAEAVLKQARNGAVALRAKMKDVQAAAAAATQKGADLASASAATALGEIRAPFEGIITRRNLSPGDFADNTTPVLEIASSGHRVDFVAGVVPSLANEIKPGMETEIEFAPQPIEGKVSSVSPADPQTGLCSVRIACVANVVSGTFSTAHVVLQVLPKTAAAPQEAILDRDGKTIVFKVVDGVAKQTEVTAGPEEDGYVAILSGVTAGDTLVKLGSFELTDGAKVTTAAPDKPDDAAKGEDKGEKKESGS